MKKPRIECTFMPTTQVPCKKHNGIVSMDWVLFEGVEYDASEVMMKDDEVLFSLYDDQGWIGDYVVSREDFDSKCKVEWV